MKEGEGGWTRVGGKVKSESQIIELFRAPIALKLVVFVEGLVIITGVLYSFVSVEC